MVSTEFFKLAYSVLKEANRLDLAEKINELREELVNLREKNINLEEENNKLRRQKDLSEKIIFKDGICWLKDDEMVEDKGVSTAICPQCWQVDGIVNRIRVAEYHSGLAANCKRCNKTFRIR